MLKKINADDIFSQIQKLDKGDTKGFSTIDMHNETGMSVEWCRITLGKLIADGRAVHAGHMLREAIDGKPSRRPIYRLVKKK